MKQWVKGIQIDAANKTNEEVAEIVFNDTTRSFPNSGVFVLVYQCPPSYSEYRQLQNSFANFDQKPGRYAVIYILEQYHPDFNPLDGQIRKDVASVCEQWGFVPFFGWYTFCMRTYYLDWIGWLSDPWWSYASYIYDLVDSVLPAEFRILVTRRIPTTYGDTDVRAIWSRNMPILRLEREGFIIIVANLIKDEGVIVSLDPID